MYKYIWYDGNFWVLPSWQYEEFMNIPRNRITPRVDPYKFSVAMISLFRKKLYVTMTNRYGDFEVGFKRDWIALFEAINEGIRLFEEEIERRKLKKKQKKGILSLL